MKLADSKNKKLDLTEVRKGLHIYKTGRSPFWYVRVWMPSEKRYAVKSSKETGKIAAREAAEELFVQLRSKGQIAPEVKKASSFEFFAKKYIERLTADGKTQKLKSDGKILNRTDDGVLAYFGKMDVKDIGTGTMRDYLTYLNSRRSEPLAETTQKKQCFVVRQVLSVAEEDKLIPMVPALPKIQAKDKPRPSFTDKAYQTFFETAQELREKRAEVLGTRINGNIIGMFRFMHYTWLRPVESELFAVRFCDVEVKTNPDHLVITVHGKTGYREVVSMPLAVSFYKASREYWWKTNANAKETDYVFMPEFTNRQSAIRRAGEIFGYVADVADIRTDKHGNKRTPYSFRHYALQHRLRESGGSVNLFTLAKNAGTSVEMLERFYLKDMGLTSALIENLQGNGK